VLLWGLIGWIGGDDSFYLSNPPESRTRSSMETFLVFYTLNKYLGKVGTTAFFILGYSYYLNKLYKAIKIKRDEIRAKKRR
jgi:hypothetical protein